MFSLYLFTKRYIMTDKSSNDKKKKVKETLIFILRIAAPLIQKFFPWLGWVVIVLYTVIELITK